MDERLAGTRVFWIAALAACLNGVAVGNLAGWPQAAIPQLLSSGRRPAGAPAFTEADVSWIAGIFFLGMLAGGFVSLAVVGRLGKRRLFLLASVPLLLGWSVVAIAASFWEFILARIILGLGGGMMCHQTEMYLSEISPRRLRGSMSVMFCACVHLGVLLSFGAGPLLSVSSATGIYLAVVLFLDAAYLLAAPETPFWLVRAGRHDEALDSLRKLRHRRDVHAELEEIVQFVERSKGTAVNAGAWTSFRRILRNASNRRAILLVVLLTTAQQFSGMAAMHSYAQLIFERAATAVPGRYVSLLLGVIEFACTVASGFLVERVGRRPLVATSTILCSICMALLGLYFHGLVNDASGALPVACIVLFALSSGLGLATMATVIAAECLSMDARNIGAAAQNTTVCFSIFLITKLWQMISTLYGQEYSFWTASAVTAAHTVLLLILLPETRGRSLTDIQRLLDSSAERTESFLPDLQNIKIVPMRVSSQLITGKGTALQ